MKRFKLLKELFASFLGAISFYTIVPLRDSWLIDFRRIARWSPLVGLILGAILALMDYLLEQINCPRLLGSVLIVAFWLFLTGGLHLDGVMDTADGLAVMEPERRLEVMKDSRVGAFGVIACLIVLLLKIAALADLERGRGLALIGAAGWGRWGQVLAIALYPYLRVDGKGAFHKKSLQIPSDLILGLSCLLIAFCFVGWSGLILVVVGGVSSYLVGRWFFKQLGGHTGDTYGAVVEWTEALFLCFYSLIIHWT